MKLGVFFPLCGNLVIGMQDRRVVAATKEIANLRQGRVREFTAEVHGNLARERDAARALFGMKVFDADLEVRSDDFLDDLERDLFLMVVRKTSLRASATTSVVTGF